MRGLKEKKTLFSLSGYSINYRGPLDNGQLEKQGMRNGTGAGTGTGTTQSC